MVYRLTAVWINSRFRRLAQVEDMYGMFWGAEALYDADYSLWDVSRVTDMGAIFASSEFDGDVSMWDTSSVVNMAYGESARRRQLFFLSPMPTNLAFADCGFEGDISQWNTKLVKDMDGMFASNIYFDGDLSLWDTSSVRDMSLMVSHPAY